MGEDECLDAERFDNECLYDECLDDERLYDERLYEIFDGGEKWVAFIVSPVSVSSNLCLHVSEPLFGFSYLDCLFSSFVRNLHFRNLS